MFKYIINICIFLPLLLGLFLLVTKLSSNQYMKVNNRKFVKILEKTPIAKDTFSLVIKIGSNAYVGISSPTGFQMIKELEQSELALLEANINNEHINNISPLIIEKTKNLKFFNKNVVKERN